MSTSTVDRSRRTQPATPIDPRLRERRNEVARDQGRRRLRRLLAGAAVVALVVAAGLVVRSPLLDVDEVVVRGAHRSGAAAVREAAGIPRGRSMVSVDADAARRRLERLAWVESARVERRWPGTVVVTVEERTPTAISGTGDDAVLVDATGRVLDRAGDVTGLPAIAGGGSEPGGHLGPRRSSLASVLGQMPGDLRREVAGASWTPAGIVLVLDDEIRVVWGDEHRARDKSESVLALLEQADRSTIARIDVSVPTAAALTRKAGGGP